MSNFYDAKDAADRFEDYIREHGISETRLKWKARLNTLGRNVIYFFLAMGVWLMLDSIMRGSNLSLLKYVLQTSFFACVGLNCAMTAYQIKTRQLCTVRAAIRDKRLYF